MDMERYREIVDHSIVQETQACLAYAEHPHIARREGLRTPWADAWYAGVYHAVVYLTRTFADYDLLDTHYIDHAVWCELMAGRGLHFD